MKYPWLLLEGLSLLLHTETLSHWQYCSLCQRWQGKNVVSFMQLITLFVASAPLVMINPFVTSQSLFLSDAQCWIVKLRYPDILGSNRILNRDELHHLKFDCYLTSPARGKAGGGSWVWRTQTSNLNISVFRSGVKFFWNTSWGEWMSRLIYFDLSVTKSSVNVWIMR